MRPLTDIERKDLDKSIATRICKIVADDPEILGMMNAVVYHLVFRHGGSPREARDAWATLLAHGLRVNADEVEGAALDATMFEDKALEAVTSKINTILKGLGE
jgi:hypothetical protein